jgi:uroporphyrinogen-III decarboxylase
MLRALDCQPVDHPPCCFMQFTALESRCHDQFDMVDQLLAWGLDATIQVAPWLLTIPGDTADLRGLPVQFHPDVQVREWRETKPGERYPTLNKEYLTPAGPLTVQVSKTDDWPYGDHVPFLDDFIIPRSHKPLVTTAEDLPALRYLLAAPSVDVVREFREAAQRARAFAGERGLLLSGGTGAGGDMAGWLCGLQNLIYLTADNPALVEELMRLIAAWNLERMAVVLEEGIDLWVRRGWYESCDFWSPRLYRRFILPHLKEEVALAHSQGVRFGYIMTSGVMPLLDSILEAGVDVLIGVDPLKGGMDLTKIKQQVNGRMCLWGGVNAPIIVEMGSAEEVRAAVREACTILAPGSGFILSPVDEVDSPSEQAWNNVQVLIEAWKEWSGLYSGASGRRAGRGSATT